MKLLNDTSDICPECTGSGMSCGEACHLCWGSGKYAGNSRMLQEPTKPTYGEQLAWLDLVSLMTTATAKDKEIIKAIKENVITVRNQELAIVKELQPVREEIDKGVNDLLTKGSVIFKDGKFVTDDPDLINAMVNSPRNLAARHKNESASLEAYGLNNHTHRGKLNPREEFLIDNRIKQLKTELQSELALKKQFRNQQSIDHCHTAIANLKKWKVQPLKN